MYRVLDISTFIKIICSIKKFNASLFVDMQIASAEAITIITAKVLIGTEYTLFYLILKD